jgi:hypothetical protein
MVVMESVVERLLSADLRPLRSTKKLEHPLHGR